MQPSFVDRPPEPGRTDPADAAPDAGDPRDTDGAAEPGRPDLVRAQAARAVALAGTANVRDLGGLAAGDGRVTRSGRLFRGGALSLLTDDDLTVLVDDLGIRTVVDLRRPREVARTPPTPLVARGAAFCNPAFRTAEAVPGEPDTRSLLDHYLHYLDADPASVVAAAAVLVSPDGQPAIFHCAVGKDRTGVLAALLLDLLGVGRELIGADYEATSWELARMVELLRGTDFYRDRLPSSVLLHRTLRAGTMVRFLDTVDDRWGGAERWLVDHGLDPAAPAAFREAMLVGAGRP